MKEFEGFEFINPNVEDLSSIVVKGYNKIAYWNPLLAKPSFFTGHSGRTLIYMKNNFAACQYFYRVINTPPKQKFPCDKPFPYGF